MSAYLHTWLSALPLLSLSLSLPFSLSLPIGAQPVLRALVGLVVMGAFVGARQVMHILERMIERH